MLNIIVNGESKIITESSVLNYILSIPNIEPEHVILEYNEKILKRLDWEKTMLKEEDRLELVRFVGGG